jgi:hypothetical protein
MLRSRHPMPRCIAPVRIRVIARRSRLAPRPVTQIDGDVCEFQQGAVHLHCVRVDRDIAPRLQRAAGRHRVAVWRASATRVTAGAPLEQRRGDGRFAPLPRALSLLERAAASQFAGKFKPSFSHRAGEVGDKAHTVIRHAGGQ